MSAVIKTWPTFMTTAHTLAVFNHKFAQFYFSLGPRKPKQEFEYLYFTHRGRILGHFVLCAVVQNAGQLPKLRSLSDETSEWQIKADAWVAVCDPPFRPLEETLYHESFRGWRYFDIDKYRGTLDAKVRI